MFEDPGPGAMAALLDFIGTLVKGCLRFLGIVLGFGFLLMTVKFVVVKTGLVNLGLPSLLFAPALLVIGVVIFEFISRKIRG